MSQQSKERESKTSFVVDWVTGSLQDSTAIRERWRLQRKQFILGSEYLHKEDWQANFALGKLSTRVRAAAGRVRAAIIHNKNWFNFEPSNPDNEEALLLAPIWKKLVDYELRQAKFDKKIGKLATSAYLDLCSLCVGQEDALIQNPEFVRRKTEKQRAEKQSALAEHVENPQITLQAEQLVNGKVEESLMQALQDLPDLLAGGEGGPIEFDEPKEWTQVSQIKLDVIQAADRYWDGQADTLLECGANAYITEIPLWKLKDMADKGCYDKAAVGRIADHVADEIENKLAKSYDRLMDSYDRLYPHRMVETRTVKKPRVVKLVVYFGPYTPEDKLEHERWGVVVADDTEVVYEWEEYPFWEPPGHALSPFVDCSIKEIPGEPIGEGVGIQAVNNEFNFDSNINLACDAMRFNVGGVNVIDYINLVDQSVLESGGISPGQVVEVRGDPSKVFHHVNLTNNVENQFSPINEMLMNSIDEHVGMNEQAIGAPTRRSRTTATEVQSRSRGQEATTTNVLIDFEQQLLIPLVEKVFARILQFQLPIARNHPGYKELLDPEELNAISSLTETERLNILNTWYQVVIEGLSSEADRGQQIDDLNEVLAIVNQGGPLSQIINHGELFKQWLRLMKIRDASKFISPGNELDIIKTENQILSDPRLAPQGRQVDVDPRDNHEMHMASHQQLANTSLGTQALLQHIQEHQQYLQPQMPQGQMGMEAPPQGALPPPGPPGLMQ